ncbi:MAG: hypothetical protein IKY01_06960 [Prevotella sp.]|nr:hypothetical protein [Prevotella sp.]MBR5748511.1 hypothetical protein [Prevotella sp.]
MEVKNLDADLFNQAYRFACQTGIVLPNATDAEIESYLRLYGSSDEKNDCSRVLNEIRESLRPPFYGYKVLFGKGCNMYLCKLLIEEGCLYTFDEHYFGAARSEKALVIEISPFFNRNRVNEVRSHFMGHASIYKVGEYVVSDDFDVNKEMCGIHFFVAEEKAIRLAKEFATHVKITNKDNRPMSSDDLPKIVRDVRDYCQKKWTLSTTHGIDHWDRVYSNGMRLAVPGVNRLVVALFAYLHDSCRIKDGEDTEHGQRASVLIDELRNTLLKDLSDYEIDLLKLACYLHTTTLKTGNPTIDACFDADRLDLWRVGVMPELNKLATENGRNLLRKMVSRHT